MKDCIFCKFANKTLSKEFLYEDERIMVFPDIHPVKPIHLLVIPKKHLEDFMALEDDGLIEEITVILQKMVQEQGLEKKGFRIAVNGGGAQAIDHLHFHLIGPLGKAAEM